MNMPGCSIWVIVGLLVMMGSAGCKQENPAEQAKVPAASGNTVTEAVGQAAVDAVKVPMDKARQTEGVLEQSAEHRAAQINKVSQ